MSTAATAAGLTEQALKHLDQIQGVINRMGQNSFFIKGWSIALVTATLAVASQQLSLGVSLLALFPAASFWYLDSYYLHQERLYRRLYAYVAANGHSPDQQRFSMDMSAFQDQESLGKVLRSKTILATHLAIGLVILACITAGVIRALAKGV
jgi:hypothetical protein